MEVSELVSDHLWGNIIFVLLILEVTESVSAYFERSSNCSAYFRGLRVFVRLILGGLAVVLCAS